MLIDWLTLRYPLTENLGENLFSRIQDALGYVTKCDAEGVIQWTKRHLDFDALRSDSSGLFWSVTADADSTRYLTIGASPSSIVNNGVNVFGTLEIDEASSILVQHAGKALDAILPNWSLWQCRRMDITMNYDLGTSAQVKEALRLLLNTDAPRRRSNSDNRGGDTVYWNPTSDLQAGKAYHKGAHLRYQQKKGNISLDETTLQLADKLIRLELKLGSRWFRRLTKPWQCFTEADLIGFHQAFFSKILGDSDREVYDMGTLLAELEKVAPTKGRALAAHRTWALIKTIGYSQTEASMSRSTFFLHCSYLRAAGLSSADLCAGQVIPFRKKMLVLSQPVTAWYQLEKAA